MKHLIYIIVFLQINILNAQEIIPFLFKNGKYGYVDKNKKVEIQGIFEEAMLFGEKLNYSYQSYNFAPIKKNGDFGYLLPNLKEIYTKNYRHEFYELYNDNQKTLNVLLFKGVDTSYYWNIKNLNTYQFKKVEKNSFNSFERSEFSDNFNMLFGKYFKVYDRNENLNYIDTNLIPLFKSLYKDGLILNQNRFLIKNIKNNIGLIDKNEKLIIPIIFESVNLICNDSLIIVKTFNNKVGLYDINGIKLLDTIYYSINKINDFFLVEKDGNKHLLNEKGKLILSIKSNYNSFIPFGTQNFISTSNDSFFIHDKNGKIIYSDFGNLEKSESTISKCNTLEQIDKVAIINKRKGNQNRYFLLKTNLEKIELDSNISYVNKLDKYPFIKIILNDQKKSQKLIDENGKVIISDGYQNIRTDEYGFIHIEKDTLFGLRDRYGERLFEANNLSIIIEKTGNDSLIWVKKNLESPYIAYNFNGIVTNKKLYVPPGLQSLFIDIKNFKKYEKSYGKIQLCDGTIIDSNYLKEYKIDILNNNIYLPYLYNATKVLNNKLENIIPLNMNQYYKDSKNEMFIVKNNFQIGIIDIKGKWIIKPRPNCSIEVINKYLIYLEPFDRDGNNRRLIKLNNKLDSIAIVKYDNNIIVEERTDLKNKYNLSYYNSLKMNLIDSLGNYITNFELSNLVSRDNNGNYFFNYLDNEKNIKNQRSSIIIDNKGKVIQELKDYEVVKKITNRAFIYNKNGKFGVIDIRNNFIIPAKYSNIELKAALNDSIYVLQATSNNIRRLIDQKGNLIDFKIKIVDDSNFEFSMITSEDSNKIYMVLSKTNINSNNQYYFYNEKFRLMSSISGNIEDYKHFLSEKFVKVLGQDKKLFYFDIINGITYKE